ncbi:MAG TPA: tetratricopeptide repeat protein [Longimicrobium sp.]|nr:tetratricopeptide repeat protein [Longimicrobium sp.]
MKIDRGLALAMLLSTAATALAGTDAEAQRGRGRGNSGTQSLPAVGCPNAARSDAAGTAQGTLNRTIIPNLSQADKETAFNTAIQQAEAGAAAEPTNPYFPYIAAQAHMGLGHTDAAVAAYRKAGELCPEMLASTVTELYNQGLAKFTANDTTGALALWQGVVDLDSTRTDATFNLGVLYGTRGDQVRSAAAFRRVATAPTAEGDSAAADRRTTALSAVLSSGATLFGQNKFREAAEIFSFVHDQDPNSRDAWYNHSLALYKVEDWTALIPVATRLVSIDPLNYNAQIILFNAYKGISEASKARGDTATEKRNRDLALRTLEGADALPVQIDGITITNGQISGTVTGGTAATGSPVALEFTLYNGAQVIGTETVRITAPAKGVNAQFGPLGTANADARVTGWKYRIVR